MNPLFLYGIKVIVCSGILVGYYWLALRNKVFHHYNRFFLLSAVVLSLVVPVIKIDFWQQQQNETPVIKLLQAVNADNNSLDEIVLTSTTNAFDWQKFGGYLYLLFVGVLLINFVVTLCRIFIIYKQSKKIVTDEISLIQTEAKGTPFSFFKLIFWNLHIDIHSTTGQQILQHEIAHIHQKHSYDKIFLNLLLITCWFNPFFWLIRKEIDMIHEFTADQKAVKDCDSSTFAAMILQAAYPQHRFKLTNHFFYSPIKRRLMMLTKNTHTKAGYISRIMVLPLAALVFVAFTFKAKTLVDKPYSGKKITVVIDAGHGGKDFGATDGNGIFEKDISLAIAQKIKELNTNSLINIVLSRETDIYQTPVEKANFINSQSADVAITIHVDAIDTDSASIRSGISFWVSRDDYSNASGSKILASSLIQTFNNQQNLPVISPMPLQRNKGVWILQAARCPIVLMEAGFITNKKDLAFLQTDNGKTLIAKNVLKGLEQYLLVKESGLITTAVTDTMPVKKIPTVNAEIDIKKALIIENGKITGIGDAGEKNRTMQADSMHVIWLKPAEAMAKYGEKARYGACELTYSNRVNYNVFNQDKQLIILNGKVIGNAKEAKVILQKVDNLQSVNINKLEPKDAVAKYGTAAAFGASEVTYSPKLDVVENVEIKEIKPYKLGNKPMYVVDGKIMTEPDPLKSISPQSIDRINVLKGPPAVVLYGAKGENGVVEIFTKHSPLLIPVKEIAKTPNSNHLGEIVLVAPKQNTEEQEADEPIFTIAENNPAFPGGDEAWKKYLMKNLEADMPVKEGWKAGVYKITVSFIVKKDGSITDVKTNDFSSSRTAEQCINLIKYGPKWQPAIQNGHKVNCYKKQPITFVVEGLQ